MDYESEISNAGYLELEKIQLLKANLNELIRNHWDDFHYMKKMMSDSVYRMLGANVAKVIVTGESTNITVYIMLSNRRIVAISPNNDLRYNKLFQRLDLGLINKEHPIDQYVFHNCDELIQELDLPNVVLINLCEVSNFPIPRLNLSTGILAAYIRDHQLANVEIIDMQLGVSMDEVIKVCVDMKPDVIGVSVSFGQLDISYSLLDRLQHLNRTNQIKSNILLGNVIPSLGWRNFLRKYPEVFVAHQEGEICLADVILYSKGKLSKNKIRGVLYFDEDSNEIKKTECELVDMNEIPIPALDTIKDVFQLQGALTLETSRGCNYSNCSFCPRKHKLSIWRNLNAKNTLKQIDKLLHVAKKYNMPSHIYLADEEFVGELDHDEDTKRIIDICKGIISWKENLKFDTSVRSDTIFDSRKPYDWNLSRIEMSEYLAKAGFDRVFVGIESGSNNQLVRLGKGIGVLENIMAIRILTALGINVRVGFIMFDQLMPDLSDILENISFLERTDVIMNPVDMENMSYDELLDKLQNDRDFISQNAKGIPVYSVVSYMLSSLEVLIGAPYAKKIRLTEKQKGVHLIDDYENPDINMGRYSVRFINTVVGKLSHYCQKWIDRNFSIMYTIKSLHKVALGNEKKLLYGFMVRYRELSHNLLKYMIYIINDIETIDESLNQFLLSISDSENLLVNGKINKISGNIDQRLMACLSNWQTIMDQIIAEINDYLDKTIVKDTDDKRLKVAIDAWYRNMDNWQLINEFAC